MTPDDTERNADTCICPECPTYDDCMGDKAERLYCARDSTDCSPSSKGCICGKCPVWSEYGLSSYYFCMEGAAS